MMKMTGTSACPLLRRERRRSALTLRFRYEKLVAALHIR